MKRNRGEQHPFMRQRPTDETAQNRSGDNAIFVPLSALSA
jgi:hypothetical protein